MFPKTKNIESSFRLIRGTCVVALVGCFCFAGFAFYEAARAVSRSGERVYILAGGKVLEAMAADRKDNLGVEARDHIATFHKEFFTLDPDEKVIADNLGKA